MTGAGTASLIKRTALWILALMLYFGGICAYISMEKSSAAVISLFSDCPDKAAAEKLLEAEREKQQPRDVCFSWDGGIQSVRNEAYGRTGEVLVTGLLGDASLYDRQAGGIGEEDREGCVIDRETSLNLFGSPNAVGGHITLGEKEYVVRRVADWKIPVMLIRPEDREIRYDRVFLRLNAGETRKKISGEFLMSSGLSGILTDDGWLFGTAALFLWLFPGAAVFFLVRTAVKEGRDFSGDRAGYWLWNGAAALALGVFFFFLYQNTEIPMEWLPDKWSDFDFWPRKIKEEKEMLYWYFMLQKTVPQTERFLSAVRAAGGGLLSLFLALAAEGTITTGMSFFSETQKKMEEQGESVL